MRFREILSGRELTAWIDLTDRIYHCSRFVPPVRQHIRATFDAFGRFDTRAAFYCVEDDSGNILARTTVHSNDALDAKLGERIQLFGYTEFVEDFTAFEVLVRGIKEIARDDDRTKLFGPSNLLPNECGGVISAGFGQRGFLDSAYNPAYYPEFYARAGFTERFSSATYICDNLQSGQDPDSVLRFDDARMEPEKLEIHYAARAQFKTQLKLLQEMLNASFSARPYYTAITCDELSKRMEGLSYLLDERLLVYLTHENRPVAFVVCIPDVSPFLAQVNGNLSLFNQIRLVATQKRYRREAIILIGGVVPNCEGQGYLRLLMRQVFRNLRSGGYDTVRTTSIERDNPTARGSFLKMKGRVLHDLAYYECKL